MVVGDSELFGNWKLEGAQGLSWNLGHLWRTVPLPKDVLEEVFSFKYVIKKSSEAHWQTGDNNVFHFARMVLTLQELGCTPNTMVRVDARTKVGLEVSARSLSGTPDTLVVFTNWS